MLILPERGGVKLSFVKLRFLSLRAKSVSAEIESLACQSSGDGVHGITNENPEVEEKETKFPLGPQNRTPLQTEKRGGIKRFHQHNNQKARSVPAAPILLEVEDSCCR